MAIRRDLQWDFIRTAETGADLGITTSFYTEDAQRFMLKNGHIVAATGIVSGGRWAVSNLTEIADLSSDTYSLLDMEHQHNRRLYGVAVKDGDKLVFLMHRYQKP